MFERPLTRGDLGGRSEAMTSLTDVRVRAALRSDRDAFLAALVEAFAADPVVRWAWPEARSYPAHFRAFAEAFGGRAFDHGTADCVTDAMAGAALWLPPGVAPDDAAVEAVVADTVPAALQGELAAMLEEMGGCHPPGPHWYLPLIGVVPARQGRGLGSALLRHALERCDRDHLPAYLESTNPANVPLYRRHGFEVVSTIQVGSSPPMHPMVRAAR
jgi:ribosomal protein S18 acetylase RimI-like enzyme